MHLCVLLDGTDLNFGYPQAHEDDAERAVRAGLELIAAVAALKTRAPLQTRVGIATGLVVVGDLIGCGGGAGARHRWRDAEPRGAPARPCRAEHGGHCRRHTKASRQSFRARGPWGEGPQGHRRAGAGLGGAAGEFGGEPLRGATRDRPDRPGRAARKNSNCCCGAGLGQRPAKARWCCSPARPVSANRG